MPRKAREKSVTNIYHVVIKGANNQLMFEERADYIKYLDLLSFFSNELNFSIYAYCLMSNHVHLLIENRDISLESIFRHINTSYSTWFNRKYQRSGYLQQGRYYSEPVDNEVYFYNVVRYIHQNPVKAGLEASVGEEYPWSSIHSFINMNSFLVSIDKVLEKFQRLDYFLELQSTILDDDVFDIDKKVGYLPDDMARKIIEKECGCKTSADFQKLPIADQYNYIIAINKKGLSIRQINRLTGVSKGVIERQIAKSKR